MSTTANRKSRTILAVDMNSKGLYVKARACGIEALVITIDALPVVFFGKGTTPYLRVQTVIEWYQRELGFRPNDKRLKSGVDVFTRILEKFKAGEIEPD